MRRQRERRQRSGVFRQCPGAIRGQCLRQRGKLRAWRKLRPQSCMHGVSALHARTGQPEINPDPAGQAGEKKRRADIGEKTDRRFQRRCVCLCLQRFARRADGDFEQSEPHVETRPGRIGV